MKDFVSYLLSSGEKVFPDSNFKDSVTRATAFANEAYMLTLAYSWCGEKNRPPISISAECAGTEISVYKVGYVPVTGTDTGFNEVCAEERYPGMFPDLLLKRSAVPEICSNSDQRLPYYEKDEDNLITPTNGWQSVFIVINPNGTKLKSGTYDLSIKITSLLDLTLLDEHIFSLEVIGDSLPEAGLCYTNWFHYDCLEDMHSAPLYSERYFQILEKYLANAAQNGMNMLLTPCFTPPLDTCIGSERRCTQLVGIEKTDKGYSFDFSLLKRFVELCVKCGIKYFEHSHLFTQWGAEHAPNIYATVKGEYKRIFGWETKASGEEYRNFLKCYIPEFMAFMKSEGLSDRVFFHISDEPTKENEKTYKKAVALVEDLLKDYPGGDALEDFKFYEKGYVKTPVVSISKADNFCGKCKDYWLYYTGGYYEGSGLEQCSNRLLTSKSYRARILGLHMYAMGAKGFLHWGYNYWYDRMTTGICDPKGDACFYKQLPGAAYLVYPGIDDVHSSLREKYMLQAINDYRALKLLEEYVGYNRVMEICEEYFGEKISVNTMAESVTHMEAFREMINNEIKSKGEV